MMPNSRATPTAPRTAPVGMKMKNTGEASELSVLATSIQPMPAMIPNAAPPSAPRIDPNRANSAIFIDGSVPQPDSLVAVAGQCVQGAEELAGRRRRPFPGSGPDSTLHDGGECVGQIAAEQLLDQVEGI